MLPAGSENTWAMAPSNHAPQAFQKSMLALSETVRGAPTVR